MAKYNSHCSIPNHLNIGLERNLSNTCMEDFNCAGYALNLYYWLNLNSPTFSEPYEYQEEWVDENEYNAILEDEWIADLLFYMDGKIRLLEGGDIIQEDEYLVYFRMGHYLESIEYADFHFVKQDKYGKLTHKAGAKEIMDFEGNVYDEWRNPYNEFLIYDGPIYLFAVKDI
ncbi:MAG: hypothetical protein IKT40_08050 [Bacilli bacterium]|nr:hypothetical protein [Bacilli bacterium]